MKTIFVGIPILLAITANPRNRNILFKNQSLTLTLGAKECIEYRELTSSVAKISKTLAMNT